jgi:hypothetical protein
MPKLLYADKYEINDKIHIMIPTVGEVLDNEDKYFEVVYTIVATPYDLMVQLDDNGIDFSKISSFDLFCLLFGQLRDMDTSLVFGDLDLKNFKVAVNNQNGNYVLRDEENDITIDRAIHGQMCACLRKLLNIPKTEKTPGNEEGRIYMLQKARKKMKRKKKQKQQESQIEDLIVALVNTAEFPYDYESVRGLSIYQFYASLRQIVHKVKFDKTMIGVYAGTVQFDKLGNDERSWILTNSEET